ncbi:MAG: S8 family peptidase [Caldilineaceae bacterium]|nr:S8 family peptidase [Caldilineaceae bacterium]
MLVAGGQWKGRRRPLRIFLALVILLIQTNAIALVPVTSGAVMAANIEPALRQFAAAHPAERVAIIVQKTTRDERVEQVIHQVGGNITKRLQIINGLAAEVPASQLQVIAAVPSVRWLSLDAPVVETNCPECLDTTRLQNSFNRTIRADQVWNAAPYVQGQGIGVAVVDSGIRQNHPDLTSRVVAKVQTSLIPDHQDSFGHGSFVAGLIGGTGAAQAGAYMGVAPKTNLIDVRVTTLDGLSLESDVIAGLEWIYDNRTTYNIRVVNLSFNASRAQSYHTSPLAAACETLWFSGMVVVASAGNQGAGALYPPANDPFVITVGAADEMGTATIRDDTIAPFSAYGTTTDGFAKPDLVAPGRKIVAPLSNPLALLALQHPTQVVNSSYIRMSGTSVAAPLVSGAIALLLQDEPHLTPDQVKYRLMATANKSWAGYDPVKAGAGYLDVYAAVHGTTDANANVGVAPSAYLAGTHTNLLLLTLTNGSVNWSSVNWSSVNWSSMTWSGDYWEGDPVNLNLPLNLNLPIKLNLLGRNRGSPSADSGNLAEETEQALDAPVYFSFLPIIQQTGPGQ